MQVRGLTTREVVTIAASTSVADVAQLLVDRHVTSLPVLDEAARLLGIVTSGDLLARATDEPTIDRPSLWKENFWQHAANRSHPERDRADGRTAAEIMTRDVLTLTPDTDLVTAARTLLKHHIRALPVMAGDTLAGIITRHDVLNQIAAHGDTINPLEH